MSYGFFKPIQTRLDRKKKSGSPKAGRSLNVVNDAVRIAHFHKEECNACPLRDLEGKHTRMPASGSREPLLYILGEAPGEQELRKGKQFVGPSGRRLRQYIPDDWLSDIRWNNVIRDRPPRNRNPTDVEIECCRPSIERDIEEHAPELILGVGNVPLKWMTGMTQITKWRGVLMPVRVRSHVCWFLPVIHPSFILRKEAEKKGREFDHVLMMDMRRAFKMLGEGLPAPTYEDPSQASQGCRALKCTWEAIDEWAAFLEQCRWTDTSTDIETSLLRPYGVDPLAHLLSLSVANSNESLAIPVSHPEATWSPAQKTDILKLYFEYLTKSQGRVVIQNLPFELEWFFALHGTSLAYKVRWEDTMAQAFVLDERLGTKSLDALTLRYFGFNLKKVSSVNRKSLDRSPLENVLIYNAMDSKWQLRLFGAQQSEIEKEGLEKTYRDQVQRIPSSVLMQRKGCRVDFEQVEEFDLACQERIEEIEELISSTKDAKAYKEMFGRTFNPHSAVQCIELLRDVLKSSAGKRGNKYSADKLVLASVPSKAADLILRLRNAQKVQSTWVEPFKNNGGKKSVIHPDGLVHTQYHMSKVETRRTSSSGPNLQNFPKRGPSAAIRSIIVPREGHVFAACDYGAMEARVIAMHSQDPVFVDSLWTNRDIHMDYAKHLHRIYPRSLEDRGGDWKRMRYDAKNKVVFPCFYGSQAGGIADQLVVPLKVAETLLNDIFWKEFKAVREWQKGVLKFYEKHGYVPSLRGFRRRMPLRPTQILNTAIQGDASDFTVEAHDRLSQQALNDESLYYLQPEMNVHDDLTFEIPEDRLDQGIDLVVREMLQIKYEWVNVPLLVEVSLGKDWASMEEHKKVRSDEIGDTK